MEKVRIVVEILDYAYLNDLVLKAQRGSSNAFAELYAATYQRQYTYSLRYLRDPHLAQDALQESFVRALRGIGRLQNPDLFIAWLGQINFRVCYDLQQKREREISAGTAEDLNLSHLHAGHGLPEEEVIAVDSRNYILRQVMNLPLVESQAILMKYYQEMTLDEIGNCMNISRSTVKRYLRSGKKHLQKMIFE